MMGFVSLKERLFPRSFSRWLRGIYYILLDMKYGSSYLGSKLVNMGLGNPAKGWHGAQSSDYHALATIFSYITIKENDVVVDVGCGRGRLFNFLLHKGINNKLIGIDVDPLVADYTRKRLKKYSQVDIRVADIEEDNSLPLDGTIFYLFNPFSEKIVKKFAETLLSRMKQGYFENSRPIIAYYNPTALHIFEQNSLWNIFKIEQVSHTPLIAAIITPARRL